MDQLQTFSHELFGSLEVIKTKDVELFSLENVAWSLGYVRANGNGVQYLRHDRINNVIEKLDIAISVHDGHRYINESGLYDFIFESGTEKAREFRKWVTSEVLPSIRKTGSYEISSADLSPELQMFNQMYKAVAKNEIETKEAKEMAISANKAVDNITNIVSITNVEWRKKVDVVLKRIAQKWTGVEPYRSVRNYSYERLEERAGCNLNIRLNNRKERAAGKGMTKTYVKKINKLDCIAEDKRLVEIYIQVVKEMAIQFKVDMSSLEEVI